MTAPIRVEASYLNKAIASKKGWILTQIARKRHLQEKTQIQYNTGDQIYFKGSAYTLIVETGSNKHPEIQIAEPSRIMLHIKPDSDQYDRESVVLNWYRKQLKTAIAGWIETWEPVLGVRINQFGVRKMKTRWGSCNIHAKRIWLNLALIEYNEKFLEYVVVHEMIHLIEKTHNHRFKSLMDRYIPDWRRLKKGLNLVDLNY